MSYSYLIIEQRYHINAYKSAGYKNNAIEKKLNVHPSTIGRELKRNGGKISGTYFPVGANNYTIKPPTKQSNIYAKKCYNTAWKKETQEN